MAATICNYLSIVANQKRVKPVNEPAAGLMEGNSAQTPSRSGVLPDQRLDRSPGCNIQRGEPYAIAVNGCGLASACPDDLRLGVEVCGGRENQGTMNSVPPGQAGVRFEQHSGHAYV